MNKNKKQNSKIKYLFLFVFLLAISVVATSIVTVRLMNKYYFDASGAIDISQNNPNAQREQSQTYEQFNTDGQNVKADSFSWQLSNTKLNTADLAYTNTSANTADFAENAVVEIANISISNSSTPKLVYTASKAAPKTKGFTASSNGTVWTTNTKVDIFKSSYSNKQGQMTVKSDDGDKVIAPGTSNSFVFKLSNTSDVPMVYELDIDAYITPENYNLPVRARLSRYDNHWVVGDKNSWVDTATLNDAADDGILGSDKYLYYTLDWEWPFEEDDNRDTTLGNIAVDEDLSLTIVINTRAAATEDPDDPDADKGITLPNTGDNSSIVIWGTVATCSLVTIIATLLFMLFIRREEEEEDSASEEA